MGKSILVTGGAGYIGSHACKALAKAGYEPVAYDNLVYGHKESVRWGPFVEGDIGDRAKVAETNRRHNIGAVMHFAAFAYVGESVEKPEKYFENNVVNTLSMLEAMRATEVKQIVYYERYCMESTTYTGVTPVCDLGPNEGKGSKEPPTTTTTAPKKG